VVYLKKKAKIKKYSTEWYLNLFDKFNNDTKQRNKYSDLYNEIYKHYEPKIRNNEISVTKEKIILEAEAGKYKGFATNFNMQLVIIPFTAMLTGLTQFIGSAVQAKYSAAMSLVVSSLMFVYIIREILKDNSNEKELICNICLKVLDDVERELKDKTERVVQNDEVAAYVQSEKEKTKPHISDGNININISLQDVVSVAHGIFRGVKVVRKVFWKNK
jgi:hypothetical protein